MMNQHGYIFFQNANRQPLSADSSRQLNSITIKVNAYISLFDFKKDISYTRMSLNKTPEMFWIMQR